MPGLSQLKKFAEEVEALGNEVKRREEKNEYLPKVPFPENASDVDDSDEFIFGLPEKKDDANENQNIDSSSDNIENIDSPIDIDEILAQGKEDSSPAESASNFSIPGIDDDLNLSSLDALDDFNFPDLDSQSPSDVSTFGEMDFTPESSSLEEMDFSPESSSLGEMDFTP